MALNNYTQVYDAGETSEVATDFIVKFGLGFLNLIAVIALLIIVGFLLRRVKGLGFR